MLNSDPSISRLLGRISSRAYRGRARGEETGAKIGILLHFWDTPSCIQTSQMWIEITVDFLPCVRTISRFFRVPQPIKRKKGVAVFLSTAILCCVKSRRIVNTGRSRERHTFPQFMPTILPCKIVKRFPSSPSWCENTQCSP